MSKKGKGQGKNRTGWGKKRETVTEFCFVFYERKSEERRKEKRANNNVLTHTV